MAHPTPLHPRQTKRPAAHADASAIPRVLPVTRPGRCAAAAGAGVFDQVAETDPFLSIDLFRRHGACIPPHPHAGCVVATYLFPESTTSLRCRHAHRGDDRLRAGDLLWLETNCGTVHEDIPENAHGIARGIRMIVSRAGRHAHGAPAQTVVRAEAMPHWREGAVDLTLICGQWGERHVAHVARTESERTTLLQLDWREDELRTLTIPCDGRRWVALIAQGEAALANHALRAEGGGAQAVLLAPGAWQLAGRTGARLLLAGGEPLDEPVVYRGNFAARDESDLVALTRRYQQGAMGTLAPITESSRD
ncbi:pirin-like C-terminal cupin domain-containing protein [Pandoraea cepalis]|uniref:Pirin-like protein n=1 Tax=Pandoraea cepalis TaxID=2508294 RepID=A0A5E4X4P4_9BURK|nr:pirin-like C-terminal cupin domain-containing protein [Pandoraea cepalis]VVE31212.1 Pirin-like protein [Pandoraea cepalis]